MDVLVDSAVGDGTGVDVSVGGAGVGLAVSVGWTVGGTTTVAAGSVGAEEGRLQAVSRNIKIREVLRKFFIAVYFIFFHSMNFISSMSLDGSRVSLSLRPSRL